MRSRLCDRESSSPSWTNGAINLQKADLMYRLSDAFSQKLPKIAEQLMLIKP